MLLGSGFCFTAQAASSSWTNDAAGTWTNAANWDNGVPGISDGTNSTDVATFGLTNTASRTITVDANRNIGGMVFSGTTGTNLVLSGGSLKLSSGGALIFGRTRNDITDTISSAIVIQGDGGSATFTANGGQFSTVLLNTGGVTGSSTAGKTTTLTLDGTSISATAARSQNGISSVIGNGVGGGNLQIIKNGPGVWTIQGNNTFSGGVMFNQGTLRFFGGISNNFFGTGTLTIADGVSFSHANSGTNNIANATVVNGNFSLTGADNVNLTGPMNLGASTRQVTVVNIKAISGSISGSGGFTKLGAGTLTLSGSNTYSGATTVSTGSLIGAADHVFSGTTNITVAAAATLTLTNGVLNDYIGKNAQLILNSTSILNLNFTGADTIGGLSLDGGTTMLPNGTYTAAQLDALPGATVAGTGSLTVGAKVFRLISITSP